MQQREGIIKLWLRVKQRQDEGSTLPDALEAENLTAEKWAAIIAHVSKLRRE